MSRPTLQTACVCPSGFWVHRKLLDILTKATAPARQILLSHSSETSQSEVESAQSETAKGIDMLRRKLDVDVLAGECVSSAVALEMSQDVIERRFLQHAQARMDEAAREWDKGVVIDLMPIRWSLTGAYEDMDALTEERWGNRTDTVDAVFAGTLVGIKAGIRRNRRKCEEQLEHAVELTLKAFQSCISVNGFPGTWNRENRRARIKDTSSYQAMLRSADIVVSRCANPEKASSVLDDFESDWEKMASQAGPLTGAGLLDLMDGAARRMSAFVDDLTEVACEPMSAFKTTLSKHTKHENNTSKDDVNSAFSRLKTYLEKALPGTVTSDLSAALSKHFKLMEAASRARGRLDQLDGRDRHLSLGGLSDDEA